MPTSTKRCSKCKETKLLEDYYSARSKDGKNSWCKECEKKKRKLYVENNYEKVREKFAQYRRKTLYDLTQEDYKKLLDSQENKCAICGCELDQDGRGDNRTKCVVDHCHDTGTVRGLLCRNCNLGIGNLQDSIDNLTNAIKYLSRFK